MRVYIRHAKKKYRDGEEYPLHDPGLTNSEKDTENLYKLFDELISLYGNPDRIVCSPFLRTRLTAFQLKELLEESDNFAPLIVDVNISESLGHRKYEKLSVTKMTGSYNVPDTLETNEELMERINYHDDMFSNNNELIWIVTHGKIMGKLYKKYFPKENKERKLFAFLDYFVID